MGGESRGQGFVGIDTLDVALGAARAARRAQITAVFGFGTGRTGSPERPAHRSLGDCWIGELVQERTGRRWCSGGCGAKRPTATSRVSGFQTTPKCDIDSRFSNEERSEGQASGMRRETPALVYGVDLKLPLFFRRKGQNRESRGRMDHKRARREKALTEVGLVSAVWRCQR